MSNVLFSELNLMPNVERAITQMGFDAATPIQSESIPVIRTGADVIARSQTGTGKTIAFSIPAIERIDTDAKPFIQVLVLCPTRELALQAYEEIQKLARFMTGIRPVAIFGGAPIDKQCIALRRANLVIGTPGRVMDHMRRKTIKLDGLKMIVLDEADEMLNMGFKEDIETILADTPEERQTVLFSATMPPAIMNITRQFQNNPTLIEIDKSQVTLENIEQKYVDVPHSYKKDALIRLLQYYQPGRAIIFSSTKKMADELVSLLKSHGISADSIHSDIKQTQRTATMRDFKAGNTAILVATDIAARGIDVSDVDYVFNYDLPPNTEYYVHRIGRTGRAGKSGCSITICGSRHEAFNMRRIGMAVKSEIAKLDLPTAADMRQKQMLSATEELEAAIAPEGTTSIFSGLISSLTEKGYTMEQVAAAALALHYKDMEQSEKQAAAPFERCLAGERSGSASRRNGSPKTISAGAGPMTYETVLLDVGAKQRVTANHIIGSLADHTGISGKLIGKIDIAAEQSTVEIPTACIDQVMEAMDGYQIFGQPAGFCLLAETPRRAARKTGGTGKSFGTKNRRRNAPAGKAGARKVKYAK